MGCHMDAPRKHGAERRKLGAKGHRLYDSLYAKCPEEENSETKLGQGALESECFVSKGFSFFLFFVVT